MIQDEVRSLVCHTSVYESNWDAMSRGLGEQPHAQISSLNAASLPLAFRIEWRGP